MLCIENQKLAAPIKHGSGAVLVKKRKNSPKHPYNHALYARPASDINT